MKLSEWIWTRIGFGLIATIAGLIWALIFYPLLMIVLPEVSLKTTSTIFIIVFIAISFINEKITGSAGLGAIYALWGAIFGVAVIDGVHMTADWSKYGKELMACFVIGIGSALITYIWVH
jgi:hypothetical protein